ncbi:MAG: CpaE family protein [Micrococcales bacterium]
MTVVLTESVASAERFKLTLGNDIAVIPTPRELLDHLEQHENEQLVVVAPEVPLTVAFELAKHYRAARPSLGVILVRNRLEVAILTQAMQAGIREVVAADDAAELLAASRRSSQVSNVFTDKQPEMVSGNRGKMVLVFSAKGGCGKTTLSTNLAEALAADSSKSVCLVDFDLQFGDVAVALQIDPAKTISDAIRMQHSLDLQGIRSLVTAHKPNLHVLLAPLDPSDVEFITPDLAQKILRGLKETYDYVVVDCPPAFTEVILRAFDMADRYLLLTTLDTPSLKNLKVTLGTLQALGMPRSKWNVVVNRSTAKSGVTITDVQNTIGLDIFATIPESDAVPLATNQGKTVIEANPKNQVAKSVREVAAKITGTEVARKRGWFRRR